MRAGEPGTAGEEAQPRKSRKGAKFEQPWMGWIPNESRTAVRGAIHSGTAKQALIERDFEIQEPTLGAGEEKREAMAEQGAQFSISSAFGETFA